jgi:antitoxin component YwqK of YwqJK toxin-antitoxin module
MNTPANAIIRCEINGKPINVSNGNETAGKSGLLRCTEEDTGQLQREQEMRNGQFIGLQRQYDREGKLSRERRVNERGNSQGVDRHFWPNGRVKTEETVENGQTAGIKKRYFENGKLEDLLFYQAGREVFAMAYYPEGYLYELRCPKTSVTPEDRKPCGFEGRQDTELLRSNGQRGALQTWEQGKLIASTTYREDGSLWWQYSREDGRRVQRMYSSADGKSVLREERVLEPDDALLTSGRGALLSRKQWGANEQLVEQVQYRDGVEARAERWYLNGSLKERVVLEGDGAAARRMVESYDDAGKLQTRASTTLRGTRSGLQQSFHSNGKLAQEDIYSAPDARGNTRLTARKSWDETGALTADDEILEDGSRKKK